jgi:prepilin signal peptidase PulO-like enzyme (type II secretory pathway)
VTAFWICAGVTAASAFVSLGFSVAAVLAVRHQARTNAMYALSRSVALAAVSLVPLISQTRSSLLTIALAMVIVQALDAAVGGAIRDRMKTFGPASLGALNLAALVWLLVS